MKSFLLTFLFAGSLLAQPAEQPAPGEAQPPGPQPAPALPDASVEVELSIVSNFVDRGEDVGAGYTQQRRGKHGSLNAPLFFQPSVTFNAPVEGLFFNVFASIAMRGRPDTDADGRLETGHPEIRPCLQIP